MSCRIARSTTNIFIRQTRGRITPQGQNHRGRKRRNSSRLLIVSFSGYFRFQKAHGRSCEGQWEEKKAGWSPAELRERSTGMRRRPPKELRKAIVIRKLEIRRATWMLMLKLHAEKLMFRVVSKVVYTRHVWFPPVSIVTERP